MEDNNDTSAKAELTKHDVGWRRIVRHFTPSYVLSNASYLFRLDKKITG